MSLIYGHSTPGRRVCQYVIYDVSMMVLKDPLVDELRNKSLQLFGRTPVREWNKPERVTEIGKPLVRPVRLEKV